jgi:hypothetical protein
MQFGGLNYYVWMYSCKQYLYPTAQVYCLPLQEYVGS